MIPVASAIDGIDLIAVVARELTLFAAVGILIGGIDDLLVDLIWLGRQGWRRLTVYRRHARGSVATLAAPERPGRIAVFIAAWDESAVIGQMLDTALARLDHPNYRIYVGCYPNDRPTRAILAATAALDPRVRPVLGPLPGPTTKADCLNSVWAAMCEDERRAIM